jgi:class 3 adenylate cyclase
MAVSMGARTSIDATYCFVDIAGYAALTDTHGELAAADLVDESSDSVGTSLGRSGRLQSLIGGCAFIVFADLVP